MATTLQDVDGEALEELETAVRGQLLRPGDDGYDEARTVWNAMIDRHPGLIIQATGVADIIAGVTFARDHDLLLAVKAGGHNVAGKAVCDDGLVIDLTPMKGVHVDPDARVARVEPGVTLGELDHETQAFGLAVPGGVISTTGVAGLTLGGGWGWLARRFGLTIDNLRRVDVVTAAGELVHASEDEHPDLFWALRGGGGNFGVVTSFEFDLQAVGPTVLGGLVIHPYEDAAELFRFHREFVADAPKELGCYAVVLAAPPLPFLPEAVHGSTVFAFLTCYNGDVETGEEVLRPLREFGDPIADVVGPLPFTAMQSIVDDSYAPGARNYWKTQLVDPLPDEAIDVIVAHGANRVNPTSHFVLEHLGGAISEVAPEATAYVNRNASFSFNVFAVWDEPADDEACIEWARTVYDDVAPYSTHGVGVNFLSEEGDDRVHAAYGDNYDRLVEVKTEWDPDNRFRMNQNVEPA